ncbi:MAG: hypothetical protein V5786_01855 [Psychromonas sp.]
MMKKISAVLLVSVFLIGCSSPAKHWEKAVVDNRINIFKNYELGHAMTAVVGNPMIYSQYTSGQDYYKISIPNVVAWRDMDIGTSNRTGVQVKWQPKYIYPGNDGDYVLTSESYYSEAIGIIVNKDGTIPQNPVMRIDKKGSQKRYPIIPYKKDLFEVSFMPEKMNSQKNYELIYSGKSQSTINIAYREYIGKSIKNGFIQTLSYDLSESNIIQFKNIKIQVLKATNTNIMFKVLSSNG